MPGIIDILWKGLAGGLISVGEIALIIFPLMIVMEIAKEAGLLDKLSAQCRPVTRILGVSENSALPLAVGLAVGLIYGAGFIMQSVKEQEFKKKDLIIISVFIVCCHAVIEDTLIFMVIGANGLLLVTARLAAAFIVSVIAAKMIKPEIKPEIIEDGDAKTKQEMR